MGAVQRINHDHRRHEHSGCTRRNQFVQGEPCLLGEAYEKIKRGGVLSPNEITDDGLGNPHSSGKFHLRQSAFLEVGAEHFHWFRHMGAKGIGMAYYKSIGSSDFFFPYSSAMAKPKRSFYDRAMEGLRERYPREKPTQGRLAALAGVRQPSVNDWKEGFPTMDTAVRLAQALNVCVEWLFTERGPKNPPRGADVPLATIWPELGPDQREQVERFADFIKHEK